MPAVAEMTKNSYCRSDRHEKCARFIVSEALGSQGVPDNLYPDQEDRARWLVEGKPR